MANPPTYDLEHPLTLLRALGRGLAHDFINSLAAARAFTELARGKADTPDVIRQLDRALLALGEGSELPRQLLELPQEMQTSECCTDIRAALRRMEPLFRLVLRPRRRLKMSCAAEGAATLPVPRCEELLFDVIMAAQGTLEPADELVVTAEDLEHAHIPSALTNVAMEGAVAVSVRRGPSSAAAGAAFHALAAKAGALGGVMRDDIESHRWCLILPSVRRMPQSAAMINGVPLGHGERLLLAGAREGDVRDLHLRLESLCYSVTPLIEADVATHLAAADEFSAVVIAVSGDDWLQVLRESVSARLDDLALLLIGDSGNARLPSARAMSLPSNPSREHLAHAMAAILTRS